MTWDRENGSPFFFLFFLFFPSFFYFRLFFLALIKFVTLTHIAKCILWESQLFEKGLQNILFKPNYGSELDTTIIFLLRKIQNSRVVILLLSLSHQDTRVFLSRDQSARAERLGVEKSSWSLWTHAGLLSTESRFPSLSSSKEFMLTVNSIIPPPWLHPQQMIEKRTPNLDHRI